MLLWMADGAASRVPKSIGRIPPNLPANDRSSRRCGIGVRGLKNFRLLQLDANPFSRFPKLLRHLVDRMAEPI